MQIKLKVHLLQTSEEKLGFSDILFLLDAELKVIRETPVAEAVKVVEGCSLSSDEGCSKVVKIGIGHPSQRPVQRYVSILTSPSDIYCYLGVDS